MLSTWKSAVFSAGFFLGGGEFKKGRTFFGLNMKKKVGIWYVGAQEKLVLNVSRWHEDGRGFSHHQINNPFCYSGEGIENMRNIVVGEIWGLAEKR